MQALSAGLFDSIERPIFNVVNGLPGALHGVMLAITQLGGLGSLVLWAGLAWFMLNRRAAANVVGTGVAAWLLAKVAKVIVHRGRPQDLLDTIHLFKGEIFSGYGFPSGHSTLSAACATVLYYQLAPKYRKYLLFTVLLVGISRMYLGAHFPLDIVGGWALGAMIGASSSLIYGVYKRGLSIPRLKKFLRGKGYKAKTLHFAGVDARGSRPLFLETQSRDKYFVKIFGKQEHAADWLFKIFRFFRYKNLQAEEPYVHSRRNIEMEAFAMLWAQQAGVRVPQVADVLSYGSSWILIQQKIDARQLSEHKRLQQKSLEDTWAQVEKLHAANIAHRDLRAANIMVDKQGKAWMIDFGFAEASAVNQRKYMDVAELLMSMSLVVGIERTLDAAFGLVSPEKLAKTLPYLQTAVFSGATTKQLKQDKELLKDLKQSLSERLGIVEDIEDARILRINRRKILNFALLAVFFYLIAPQFSGFKHAFNTINISQPLWLLPLAAASLLTYVLTGAIYASLAPVPLKIRQAALVQLAASFMSKILPGGIGGTSLNVKYMQRAGMDLSDTSAVIATQGAIGFVMFTVPLTIFLVLNGQGLSQLFHFHLKLVHFIIAATVVAIAAVCLAFIRKLRVLATAKLLSFIQSIRDITTPGRELALACAASFAVTLAYIACLYASFKLFSIPLGITAAIFVYASAVIARSAVPTPGGLGPLEAAMIAAMVGLGASKDVALQAVILYRLATFWLPIPFSLLAYKYIGAKKII